MTITKLLTQSIVSSLTQALVPPFLPSSLDNNILWSDSDDISTITELVDKVSKWNDKSGKNNHAVQLTSTLQPITNLNKINNRNVINWDLTDDVMTITNSSSVNGMWATGATIIIVLKSVSVGGSSLGTIFQAGWHLRKEDGGTSIRLRSTFTGTNGIFKAENLHTIGESSFIMVTYDASNTVNRPIFYKNGGVMATTTTTAPVGSYNPTTNNILIGNRGAGDRAFDGDFGEFIWYDRILTTSERTLINNYLSIKWNIALA